jgi:hypothetical protein
LFSSCPDSPGFKANVLNGSWTAEFIPGRYGSIYGFPHKWVFLGVLGVCDIKQPYEAAPKKAAYFYLDKIKGVQSCLFGNG